MRKVFFIVLCFSLAAAVLPGSVLATICYSGSDCTELTYCAKAAGQCFDSGTCAPKPFACIQVFMPVCGCDGLNYTNPCEAAIRGVNVAYNGYCGVCPDNDGDGYSPAGGSCGQVDCNDNNAAIYPGAVEICDNTDNNCNGLTDEGFDLDRDGFTTCRGDCNDNNAAINPAAVEICDNLDNNCNGLTDENFDLDGDQYTTCDGDCNDNNAAINPGAIEICDNLDNNCNGLIDENFDLDGDQYSSCAGDCNDGNPTIYPGAPEIKNDGIDQDCNTFDLTIVITNATYNIRTATLAVTATSALRQGAGLFLDGYGSMSWNNKKSVWSFSKSGVARPPTGKVRVYGIEGEETALVKEARK